MGSDDFPIPDVIGAVMAAREYGVEIILVGDETKIGPLLSAAKPGQSPHPRRPCTRNADDGRQGDGTRLESPPPQLE